MALNPTCLLEEVSSFSIEVNLKISITLTVSNAASKECFSGPRQPYGPPVNQVFYGDAPVILQDSACSTVLVSVCGGDNSPNATSSSTATGKLALLSYHALEVFSMWLYKSHLNLVSPHLTLSDPGRAHDLGSYLPSI